MSLQYSVARGLMKFVAESAKQGVIEASGLTQEEFNLVVLDVPWTASVRNRIQKVLLNLCHYTSDAMSLPRFQLPAEYIASVIALYVAPVNVMSACRVMERLIPAEALGRDDETDYCSAKQLFALCSQLYADGAHSSAVALWEKNTNLSLERAKVVADSED